MTFSIEQKFFIDLLRSELSMRYVKAEGSSYFLYSKLGDEELWEDLRLGLNYFNSYPPNFTTYSFSYLYQASKISVDDGGSAETPQLETLASILTTPVIMCALFFVGLRLQWFEAGKHFQYNDNGISLVRDKQPRYQSVVGQNILQYLSSTLAIIKTTIGFKTAKIKGSFSGMVSYPRSLTRGLRGTRLGLK